MLHVLGSLKATIASKCFKCRVLVSRPGHSSLYRLCSCALCPTKHNSPFMRKHIFQLTNEYFSRQLSQLYFAHFSDEPPLNCLRPKVMEFMKLWMNRQARELIVICYIAGWTAEELFWFGRFFVAFQSNIAHYGLRVEISLHEEYVFIKYDFTKNKLDEIYFNR